MPFQPVILATDALIYVLVLVIAGFVVYARRQPHLLAPWQQVSRRPVAMGAWMIIVLYLIIGLSDTLHFRLADGQDGAGQTRYATQVVSLLDVMTRSLQERREKTYSAPFATHLYSKETIDLPDGSQQRSYPPLRHGGQHLANPSDRMWDIAWRGSLGAAAGSGVFVLLLLMRCRGRRVVLRELWQDPKQSASRSAWGVLAGLCLLIGAVISLSTVYHVLGTDKVGEDVLYQALKSVRTGLVIGTLTTLVMLPAALLLGAMAGYFRGWVDDLIQYLYTTLSSVPGVLLIAAAILMMQVYMSNHPAEFTSLTERSDFRLLFLCLILGLTSWTSLCRLLRGEALKLRQMDYVQAAQALGVGHFTILWRHIVPNVMHIVLIVIVLDFSGLVLAEAVLSYINIGVDPNTYSWGNMINSARLELAREPVVWWSLTAAFGFMFVLVLAANLLADAVRDAFDPR
ncbi:MAG: ABC transporter permease [Pseudomonadota bacterium]